MKVWDFEDEDYNHFYCYGKNKKEARKDAKRVLAKHPTAGKRVINLRRNPQDEFEEWMKRSK